MVTYSVCLNLTIWRTTLWSNMGWGKIVQQFLLLAISWTSRFPSNEGSDWRPVDRSALHASNWINNQFCWNVSTQSLTQVFMMIGEIYCAVRPNCRFRKWRLVQFPANSAFTTCTFINTHLLTSSANRFLSGRNGRCLNLIYFLCALFVVNKSHQ